MIKRKLDVSVEVEIHGIRNKDIYVRLSCKIFFGFKYFEPFISKLAHSPFCYPSVARRKKN